LELKKLKLLQQKKPEKLQIYFFKNGKAKEMLMKTETHK